MRYGYMLAAFLAAGCASEQMPLLESEATPPPAALSCEGQSASQCKFINSPVKLSSRAIHLPDSPYPFFKTRNELKFIDADGSQWIAPAGILTDGASIPPLFVSFIGSPRSKQFMNAATVHDSYCAESNRNGPYYHTARWQKVHHMFYDGLRASGTSPIKAKIMYAAVYLGGPRWKTVRKPGRKRKAEMTPAATGGTRQAMLENGLTITAAAGPGWAQSDVPLPKLFSKERLISAFKQAKAHIKANNPSIGAVEVYLTRMEHDLSGTQTPPAKKPGRNFGPGQFSPDTGGGGEGGLGDDQGRGGKAGGGYEGPSKTNGY